MVVVQEQPRVAVGDADVEHRRGVGGQLLPQAERGSSRCETARSPKARRRSRAARAASGSPASTTSEVSPASARAMASVAPTRPPPTTRTSAQIGVAGLCACTAARPALGRGWSLAPRRPPSKIAVQAATARLGMLTRWSISQWCTKRMHSRATVRIAVPLPRVTTTARFSSFSGAAARWHGS